MEQSGKNRCRVLSFTVRSWPYWVSPWMKDRGAIMQVDKENPKIIYLDGEEFDKLKEKLLKGDNGEEAYEISKKYNKYVSIGEEQ